jgi:hypothetical protein
MTDINPDYTTMGRVPPAPQSVFIPIPPATSRYLADVWHIMEREDPLSPVTGMEWLIPPDHENTITYPGDYRQLNQYRIDYINTIASMAEVKHNVGQRRLFGSPVALFPLLGATDIPDSLLLDSVVSGVICLLVDPPTRTLDMISPHISMNNVRPVPDDLDAVVEAVNNALYDAKAQDYTFRISYVPQPHWPFHASSMIHI